MSLLLEIFGPAAPALPAKPGAAPSASPRHPTHLQAAELSAGELKPINVAPAAEALVLIEHLMVCEACGSTWRSPESNLFLRTKGHYWVNRLDPIFTRALPKEVKQLRFRTPACAECFLGFAHSRAHRTNTALIAPHEYAESMERLEEELQSGALDTESFEIARDLLWERFDHQYE